MGSLFDLAADLSQYALESPQEDAEDNDRRLKTRPGVSSRGVVMKPTMPPEKRSDLHNASTNQETGEINSPLSTLSLLDEALLTIYEAQQPQQHQRKPTGGLIYQRSAPDLQLAAYRDFDADTERMKTQHTPTRSHSITSTNPLQNVFAQSFTIKPTAESVRGRIPPPPRAPSALQSSSTGSELAVINPRPTQDSDVEARTALRELQEEIEQLPHGALANAVQIQCHQRVLMDKYLGNRLNQLPGTPFVMLAKRKIQQKIDHLSEKLTNQLPKPKPVTVATPTAATSSTTLPAAQHEMLIKLAQIPDSHVAKLSSTQQKMVQFAKRYDKVLKLSSDEMQRLPVSQAQLLQQLRDQLPRDAK